MNKELAEAAGRALTDFLIGNYVSSDPVSHIVESQSAIIKKQREEIERLEHEIAETNLKTFVVSSGDFSLKHVVSKGHFLVFKDGNDSRRVSEADVNKKLRELYFRTEEKRSCENCNATDHVFQTGFIFCTRTINEISECKKNNLKHWQPRTT